MDPTFNGYYTNPDGSFYYSAYDLREKVKFNELSELKWNENGHVKPNYDISKYYLNPLYLLKGLMYRPDISNNAMYYILDDWSPYFDKEGTVYEWSELSYITRPSQIGQPAKWGIDKGNYTTPHNWKKYNDAKLKWTGTFVEVNAKSGGIKTTISTVPGRLYQIQFPVYVNSGTLTTAAISGESSQYHVLENTGSTYVATPLITAKDTSMDIYIYQDSPVHFKIDISEIKVWELVNDFESVIAR